MDRHGTEITERALEEIQPGDHLAFPFRMTEERQQVIGAFLRDGLAAHQKIIYLSDLSPSQLTGLSGRPDIEHLTGTGQLRVIPRSAACLTQGRLDPDLMHTIVKREITAASDQGYRAVRITADMTRMLDQPCGYRLALACEAILDQVTAPNAPVMAICELDCSHSPTDRAEALADMHQLRVKADMMFNDGVLLITRTHIPPGLRLIGEIDASRHRPFLTALSSIGRSVREVHLDFVQLRFLDLSTLRLLVTYAMRSPAPGTLILDYLPPDIHGLMETLGWRHMPGLIPGHPRTP